MLIARYFNVVLHWIWSWCCFSSWFKIWHLKSSLVDTRASLAVDWILWVVISSSTVATFFKRYLASFFSWWWSWLILQSFVRRFVVCYCSPLWDCQHIVDIWRVVLLTIEIFRRSSMRQLRFCFLEIFFSANFSSFVSFFKSYFFISYLVTTLLSSEMMASSWLDAHCNLTEMYHTIYRNPAHRHLTTLLLV